MDENSDDQGLRVFTLAPSGFQASAPVEADGLFNLSESTLVEPVLQIDALAAEILIKEGIRLDAPWKRTVAGAAWTVGADGVLVVLSPELEDETVDVALSLEPRVLVFLEDGFARKDLVKVNAFTKSRELGTTMKTV